ncbi:hypothetical protein CesoFtcFv8_004267 [Champsocephalus esox]|uniref:Uncharacterized protein n=1 Tax=Champsocephalus esox TaxID=159716 RepID=A0AAN8HCQ3_9TELE|nr:hypothetical protein CesoFtcFv8_004267 [Champsocephalus esox]
MDAVFVVLGMQRFLVSLRVMVSVPVSEVLSVFLLLLLVVVVFSHAGIPQRLRPSAVHRTTEWLHFNDSRAGICKPTTVPSRSNQESVIKRLWRRALQPPGVGWAALDTEAHIDSLGVEAGLTLPHHVSREIRETEHASGHV